MSCLKDDKGRKVRRGYALATTNHVGGYVLRFFLLDLKGDMCVDYGS